MVAEAAAPAQAAPTAPAHDEAAPTAPAHDEAAPMIAELRCVSEPLPERVRVQFEPGHTARDLAVWYATLTCQPVVAPRAVLGRSTLTQVDALVGRDELFSLLTSLLRGVGLVAFERGDEVAISIGSTAAERTSDDVVLAPVRDENRDAEPDGAP